MKKKLLLGLSFVGLTALIFYLAVSCKEKDLFEPQLNLSVNSLNITAISSSTDTFSITSNTSWTISSSQTWLKVTPASGSNNSIITITSEQNKDTVARTAMITVSAESVTAKTINVVQGGTNYNLSISKLTVNINSDANSVDSIIILSDTSWAVSCSESWLTITPALGSKNGTVKVTAQQNSDTAARTAILVISASLTTPQSVKVIQSGELPRAAISKKSISLPPAASKDTFTITSNTDWTITKQPSWLTVSPTSGSKNGVVTVTAAEFFLGAPRSARLTISAKGVHNLFLPISQRSVPCSATDEVYCEIGGCGKPTMPTYEALPTNQYLPDPFTFMNSSRMTSKSEWTCRRAEIAALAQEFELGYKPCTPYTATSGASVTVQNPFLGTLPGIKVTVNNGSGKEISFDCSIMYPTAGSAPYPAVIAFGYSSLDNQLLSSLGVAIINFPNDDIAEQGGTGSRGIGKFYDYTCFNQSAGALMAWAWGISRLVDALEKTPEVNIDPKRLGVTGCSRNGKGALIAGAFDERIVLTIPQESGSGGAASWRVSDFQGSSVQRLQQIVTENCWLRGNFNQFSYTANKLPFDHHSIMALCAPRALLVIENTDQVWLGNISTWTTGNAAHMVWEALGISDKMGFSQNGHSDHCGFPAAQKPELSAYVKKFLVGDGTDDTNLMKTDGSYTFDKAKWVDWTIPSLQ
jgi:hypothetical protein